jgi:2-dehydropantoate 2-reductase
MSAERVLVVGAGAIGGVVGAALTRAGEDVLLVEADEAHLGAMQRDGLRIEGYPESHTVRVKATRPDRLEGPFDVAFLAVKSQHTETALAPVTPLLAPRGCVVSLQNGINETRLAELLGPERVLGAVIHLAADQMGPGLITRYAQGEFFLGELDGADTPRVRSIQRLLQIVAPTTVSNNILGWLWTKQIYGCLLVASALADETITEQLAVPEARAVHAAVLSEATRVALADGIKLERLDMLDPLDTLPSEEHGRTRAFAALDAIATQPMKGKSGMWRDIRVKGRKSESEHITGYIAHRGRALGVPTPVNVAVLEQIQEIEAGRREMSMHNFHVLAELADEWRENSGLGSHATR